MSHDTQVKQEPDVERWKRELSEAGWTAASATAWYDPSGGLYRGPYGAWKELQRRRGVLLATDADAAKAREIIGNVNNYAEDDGELSISAFGPLSTRIAEALATVRREEQANFVNNVAAVLDADDVEVFTALIMKAKASPDLNSDTRSALKSETEIRREEREAAFKEAIDAARAIETNVESGALTDAVYVNGFKTAQRFIVAALEAAATEKR